MGNRLILVSRVSIQMIVVNNLIFGGAVGAAIENLALPYDHPDQTFDTNVLLTPEEELNIPWNTVRLIYPSQRGGRVIVVFDDPGPFLSARMPNADTIEYFPLPDGAEVETRNLGVFNTPGGGHYRRPEPPATPTFRVENP